MIKNKKTCIRLLCVILVVSVVLAAFASCKKEVEYNTDESSTLTVGYTAVSSTLNPFYVNTECDEAIMGLTQLRLLTLDRVGDVVKNGIEGESRAYAGTDYYYSGICDISVIVSEASGMAEYTVTLRPDLKFSDGHAVTADDVIFTYYVLCDPSYNGTSEVRHSPITGLGSYMTQTEESVFISRGEKFDAINAAGFGHLWNDDDAWTQDEQNIYDKVIAEEWKKDLEAVTEYCVSNFASQYGSELIGISGYEISRNADLHVAFAMAAWGFAELNDDGVFKTVLGTTYSLRDGDYPDIESFYSDTHAIYSGDPKAYWDDVNGGEIDSDNVITAARNSYISAEGTGEVTSISGITKIDDLTVKITADSYDAADIYKIFDLYVAPLHHYGDESLFRLEDGMFGFVRGDLTKIEESAAALLGGGMYSLKLYSDNEIILNVNEEYYADAAQTEYIKFIRIYEEEKVSSVSGDGAIDIITIEGNSDLLDEIRYTNSGGELSGDAIVSVASDIGAYGYIGINANNVCVGNDPDSKESLSLRRAFATLFSVYRDAAVSGYYGESARVINYPTSETSYIAYDVTDENYKTAFSVAADGSNIYTPDMDTEARYAAALDAAIDYFIAAGYSYDEITGEFTRAPEGASLEFEAIVPGNGTGDHPCYSIIQKSAQTLQGIGITLTVTDPASSSLLWGRLRTGSQQIWCAAYTVDPEPDMRDSYTSSSTPDNGGLNYYGVDDDILDYYINTARVSSNRASRQISYRQCMDLILDWAIQVPVYQRQSFTLFSSQRIDTSSIPSGITIYHPWYLEAGNIKVN